MSISSTIASILNATEPDDGSAADEEQSSRATLKMTFALAYFALFVFGTIGNGVVIVMTINVLTSMHKGHVRKKRTISSTNHVFIYVLGLSIVDLLVILHLPFLILDLMKGQWLFGNIMCKLYWFGESVNKLLSSFIMTVLSWDRYLAVCSPVKSMKMRSNMVAVSILLVSSAIAIVLLLPVLVEARIVKIDRVNMIPLMAGSIEEQISDTNGYTICKCMFESDVTFVMYTFFIGFALPAVLITAFYLKVIRKVQINSKNIRRASRKGRETAAGRQAENNANRVKQVTKRIVTVILFYYFCWTPQWTLNLMSQFNMISPSWITPALSAIFFGAHLLVCFNSAVNPVLYALINRELRTQHSAAMKGKRQSISQATQMALEFVARHTHNEQKERETRTSLLPPISTHLRHSIAGIKMNVFNSHKSSMMNGPLTIDKLQKESCATTITRIPSEGALSMMARKEAESREELIMANGDAFL